MIVVIINSILCFGLQVYRCGKSSFDTKKEAFFDYYHLQEHEDVNKVLIRISNKGFGMLNDLVLQR